MTSLAASAAPASTPWRRELSGAVADLGVFVPIAVALIVRNGLSATYVFLPAGLLYVAVGLVYRIPVSVQPLKALGAIAIAKGLGPDEIAAASLLLGGAFVALGATKAVDLAARAFPRAVVRGVQLTVGLLFIQIAWRLLVDPPASFEGFVLPPGWAIAGGVGVVALCIALRRHAITLVLVGVGAAVMIWQADAPISLGPSPLGVPSFDSATFWAALTVLVLPQLPLSFANSCLAAADASRVYYGDAARRVTPRRLATSLGLANLFSGSVAGMPVCHGAGGITAHYTFGARTARAPIAIGAGFVGLAVVLGASLATLLPAFPLPILAGLLATAGLLHIGLLRDLRGARQWLIAAVVGLLGFQVHLALGLVVGLALWWVPELVRRSPAFSRA